MHDVIDSVLLLGCHQFRLHAIETFAAAAALVASLLIFFVWFEILFLAVRECVFSPSLSMVVDRVAPRGRSTNREFATGSLKSN